MKENLTRAFICLPLPEEVKMRITRLAAQKKAENPGFKWVGDFQYHITLKFCGSLTTAQLADLKENVGQKLASDPPGKIRLVPGHLGAFPNLRRARVVFLEVGGETKKLEKLAALVESAAIAAGLPKEDRPFHPHITLARTKSPEPLENPPEDAAAIPAWTAETALLMQSDLKPSGPVYTKLHEWKLEKN